MAVIEARQIGCREKRKEGSGDEVVTTLTGDALAGCSAASGKVTSCGVRSHKSYGGETKLGKKNRCVSGNFVIKT